MTPAEKIAAAFHAAYEALAPSAGYETRKESAVPWDEVPANNKALMTATVEALLSAGVIRPGGGPTPYAAYRKLCEHAESYRETDLYRLHQAEREADGRSTRLAAFDRGFARGLEAAARDIADLAGVPEHELMDSAPYTSPGGDL